MGFVVGSDTGTVVGSVEGTVAVGTVVGSVTGSVEGTVAVGTVVGSAAGFVVGSVTEGPVVDSVTEGFVVGLVVVGFVVEGFSSSEGFVVKSACVVEGSSAFSSIFTSTVFEGEAK